MSDFWEGALSGFSDEERYKDYPKVSRERNHQMAHEITYIYLREMNKFWSEGDKINALFGAIKTAADDLDLFDGSKMQCKSGCSSCCHQHLPAMQAEVFLIALSLEEQGLINTYLMETFEVANKIDGLSHADRFANKIACPFLVKKTCGIYEERPLVCRAHFSANRRRCEKSFKYPNKVDQIPIPYWAEPKEYLNGPTLAMGAFCYDKGLPTEHVEFERAMAILFKYESIMDAWTRWLDGEDILKEAGVGDIDEAKAAYEIINRGLMSNDTQG